jgi:hypothetical protein
MVAGTGKHKTRGVDGKPDLAFVVDRSISFDMGEMLYRNRGYLPSFDELPWKDEPVDD